MSSAATLAIAGDFTIYAAQTLKERLVTLLHEGDEIEVDLSQVTELDSAGVQLLIATQRAASAEGKTLRFTGPSPAVVDTLALCNLSGHFGVPQPTPHS